VSHDASDEEKQISDSKNLSTMIRQGFGWSGEEKNCSFLNLGTRDTSPSFATISTISGLDAPDDGRAVSLVDWDHDGDLDIWVKNRTAPRLRFYRNERGNKNGSFISIKLIGDGITANRDAIGARIEIIKFPGDRKLIKTVRLGESFLSQNSSSVHVGLGTMEEKFIKQVIIHWPSATPATQTITDLAINTRYRIEQGKEPVKISDRNSSLLSIKSGAPQIPPSEDSIRIPAISLISAPQIRGRDFRGRELVTNSHGKWTLVNLWASWCQPCIHELSSWSKQKEKIESAGIRVIAFSVDGVGENEGNPQKALNLLQRLRFPFEAGFAHETFLDALQQTTDMLTGRIDPLSLPMSVLMDPENRVVALYRGILDLDQVIRDVSTESRTLKDRWLRASNLKGELIENVYFEELRTKSEATIMYRIGRRYDELGKKSVGEYYWEKALEYWPDFNEARSAK